MLDAPVALAVSAGSLAALNPCGFALLPAYLSLLVVGGHDGSRAAAVRRALAATAAITGGFAAVFVTFGLLLSPVAATVQRWLPWFTVGFGAVLAVLGLWLVAGRSLPGLPGLARRAPALRRSALSMAGFGAAYALSSLSCTIGPFLAIVVSAFRAGSPASGVTLFAAYAFGMGAVVAVASLAVALARESVLVGLRRSAPLLSRISGLVMVAAGAYVAYYGVYERAVLAGADPQDPVIEAAARLQGALAGAVEATGVPVLLGVAVAGAVVGVLVTRVRRRRAVPGR